MDPHFDQSKKLRGPIARKEFVKAIVEAPGLTESDAVEWKGAVDLRSKAWHGELASHVLGFANRDPSRATRAFEGHAYLLVGAEPGRAHGLDCPDPADLENWLGRYLGRADGPVWDPHPVNIGNATVLLVEVGAPPAGSGAFPLRKTFTGPDGTTIAEGTIFVRRVGKTERANASEIDMLNRRASAQAPTLQLELDLEWWDRPPDLQTVELSQEAQTAWLEHERRVALASLKKVPPTTSSLGQALTAMTDTRSPSDYRSQVERYLSRAAALLPIEVRRRAVERGVGRLHLAVVNRTDHNFADTEVEWYVPADVAAFFSDEADSDTQFPGRPAAWGTHSPLTASLGALELPTITPLGHHGSIDNSASARIRFPPVDVRPAHRHALAECFLVPSAVHAGQTLRTEWSATSTSVSGIARGSLDVSVGSEVIAFGALMPVDETEDVDDAPASE